MHIRRRITLLPLLPLLLLVFLPALASEHTSSDFSIRLQSSKTECYLREEITLELAIESSLTTIDIRFSKYDLGIPSSFLVEGLPLQQDTGKVVIRRKITPLAPGPFRVGPGRIHTTIMLPDGELGVVFRQATFSSNDLYIDVKPLPKPESPYPGVIPAGVYDFDASVDRPSAQVGETAIISYRVSGDGSMRTFLPPTVPSSDTFSTGPILDRKTTTAEDGTMTLTYRQEITPLSSQVSGIPAISFPYFDTGAGEYRTIVRGPFQFDVRNSIRSLAVPDSGTPETMLAFEKRRNTGLMAMRKDVGRIRSETVETIYTPLFWIIQSIPLFAVAISALYVTYRRRIESVEFRNYSKAYSRAKRELRRSRKLLKSAQVRECFDNLPRILAGYVGDKLNIPSGGITNYEILRHVREYTKRKRFLRMVETLLGLINQARYTQEPLDPKKVRKWLKTTERALHYMEWHRTFRSAEKRYIKAISESQA